MKPYTIRFFCKDKPNSSCREMMRGFMEERNRKKALLVENVVIALVPDHHDPAGSNAEDWERVLSDMQADEHPFLETYTNLAPKDAEPIDPWAPNMIPEKMVKAGWDPSSIALGFALGCGFKWEDYGSTWEVRGGAIHPKEQK